METVFAIASDPLQEQRTDPRHQQPCVCTATKPDALPTPGRIGPKANEESLLLVVMDSSHTASKNPVGKKPAAFSSLALKINKWHSALNCRRSRYNFWHSCKIGADVWQTKALLPHQPAPGALRFSLGLHTTQPGAPLTRTAGQPPVRSNHSYCAAGPTLEH